MVDGPDTDKYFRCRLDSLIFLQDLSQQQQKRRIMILEVMPNIKQMKKIEYKIITHTKNK